MEENNMEQAMTTWLSEEVKKYCNADGMIETYWDYQDREALNDEIKRYAADFEGGDLIEHIADNMREENWYLNWCDEYEDDFFAGIRNDAPTIEDEELRNYVVDRLENMDYTDLRDELEVAGYNGVDDGIESELKDVKVNVNLTLATDNEANYDMSSIITCFGTDYLSIEFDSLDASHLDNALTYLIHQQGHTLKEYYDSYLGNADGGKLLKSIGTEVNNNPAEATCGLTVLVSIGLGEYSAILSKEGNIEVSADTEVGLYNSWIGGGSVFEISLEKPFVFPASMVLHADLDDVTGTGAYSVGDTYGTMGDDRTGTIKKGGEASVVDEDLEAVADYVRATYDNGEEVEESKKITETVKDEKSHFVDFGEWENFFDNIGYEVVEDFYVALGVMTQEEADEEFSWERIAEDYDNEVVGVYQLGNKRYLVYKDKGYKELPYGEVSTDLDFVKKLQDTTAEYTINEFSEEVEESKKITENEEPEEDKELDFKERVRLAYENCSCSCGMPTIKNIVDYLDMNFEYDDKLHNEIGDILYELGYDWKLEEMKENKKVTEGLRQDTIDAIDLAINEIDNGNSDDPDWFNEKYDTYEKLVQGVLDLMGANIKYGSGVEKEPTSAVNFSGKEAIINEIKRQLAEWGYKESDFGKKTEDIASIGDLRDSIDTENLIEPEDEFEVVFDSDVGDLTDIKNADADELEQGGELASLYRKDDDNKIVVTLEYGNGFFINTYYWNGEEMFPDLVESIEIAITPETTEKDIKDIMIRQYNRIVNE